MQQSSDILSRVRFLVNDADGIMDMNDVSPKQPFDPSIVDFLDTVSRKLLGLKELRAYPDIASFAFWIRKSSVLKLKERSSVKGTVFGRGVAFHVAPSNVPVNFAYSLAVGLMSGNANIVRVPSKEFEQVGLIAEAVESALKDRPDMRPYAALVRYDRDDRAATDLFSAMADVRVIWGGDQTVADIRRSPIGARAQEITFADRYSFAVIDSDSYLDSEDKGRIIEGFYNDTYWTDQNACTSPQLIVWHGKRVQEARKDFWERLGKTVRTRYDMQPVQSVDKYSMFCSFASGYDGNVKMMESEDNLIVRVEIDRVTRSLTDFKFNSGLFAEYICNSAEELADLCNDKKVQTVSYIGDPGFMEPVLRKGVKGVDRVVPVGQTMDFDIVWDGYSLIPALTRTVDVR